MNNSDFYKLKYLKYKNKYISLKNKNELELKGGLTSESGIFLFYIPETVLTANNIRFPLEEAGNLQSRLIIKDGKITTLSFQNLYDMSILVIPPAPDKVNISSTNEWYIPLKKSKLKWNEKKPINYDRGTNKIEYDSTSRKRWLYYIAKEFLNTNSKEFLTRFKLADLDNQIMICLEYDVSHVIANKFISKTYIDSIKFFQHYLNKYYKEYTTIDSLKEEKKKLDADLKAVSKKYYDALTKASTTYKIFSDTQKQLKTSEDKSSGDKKKITLTNEQIETLKKQIEEYKELYKIDTANEETEQHNKNTIDEKLKNIIKLEEFLATNLEFVTANYDLFRALRT
jgi:hypothetical protein